MNDATARASTGAKSIRLRRSVLFMPGSNLRALDKARTLAADAIIMDLEDAVAPSAKALAREQIGDALMQGGYGARECIVRVNALDTPWGEADLRAAAHMQAQAVLLPKVECAADIDAAMAVLRAAGAAPTLNIWAMIETPTAVLDARQICTTCAPLDCLVMGTSDLANMLRVAHTTQRTGLINALSHCVLVAREAGLDALDGVQLDLHDDMALEAVCAQASELGFDGKTLIHPRQIDAANRAFSPNSDHIDKANHIVSAWQQAEDDGSGVVVVDGQLVEHFHVTDALRTLAIAEAIAKTIAIAAPPAGPDGSQ